MAEGTTEIAPEGKEGTGHAVGEIQEGELLQSFDEHRNSLWVNQLFGENEQKFQEKSCGNVIFVL